MPGIVASSFARNNRPLYRLIMTLQHPFAISPERGAQAVIYLATAPELESTSGTYFIKSRPVKSSPTSYDEAAARGGS